MSLSRGRIFSVLKLSESLISFNFCQWIISHYRLSSSPRIISESGGLVLEAGQNRNISLRTSGSGKINLNLQDLTGLVDKLGGQREEHSGAVLSGRLELLESELSGLTGEEGRLVGLESQLRQLREAVESSDDTDRRLRR